MVLTEVNLYHMPLMKRGCHAMMFETKDEKSLKWLEQHVKYVAPGDYQFVSWCDRLDPTFDTGFRIQITWSSLEDATAWILQNS